MILCVKAAQSTNEVASILQTTPRVNEWDTSFHATLDD